MTCRPCPMYTRLAQEDSQEESTLPSNNNRRSSSASWGLLAIAIVVLLLLTFPRLPQAPNKVRPSPAFHYMPALPLDTDEATTSNSTEMAQIQADENQDNIETEMITTSAISSGSPPQCVPAEKVGFAKTHKTASSTVQNIFLRWGLNQGWNFALLTAGSHLGPPNNQYVLNQPFQVLCKTFCKCHPIFLPGFLVERSTLGGYG